MKIKEKFKEKIYDIACEGRRVTFDKSGNIACCGHIACNECIVKEYEYHACDEAIALYMNEEYIIPCPFEKDELVEVSDDGLDWKIRHFARMRDDDVFPYSIYSNGVSSKDFIISESKYRYCRKYGTLGGLIKEEEKCK